MFIFHYSFRGHLADYLLVKFRMRFCIVMQNIYEVEYKFMCWSNMKLFQISPTVLRKIFKAYSLFLAI